MILGDILVGNRAGEPMVLASVLLPTRHARRITPPRHLIDRHDGMTRRLDACLYDVQLQPGKAELNRAGGRNGTDAMRRPGATYPRGRPWRVHAGHCNDSSLLPTEELVVVECSTQRCRDQAMAPES